MLPVKKKSVQATSMAGGLYFKRLVFVHGAVMPRYAQGEGIFFSAVFYSNRK